MFKGRRVGTLTAGIVFIAFGILFLLSSVFNLITYSTIISLWPVIIILIGIEILFYFVFAKEQKVRFDGGAIALTIILTLFSTGMGLIDYCVRYLPSLVQNNWI